MAQISVDVPAELNVISDAVTGVVTQLMAGDGWVQVVGAALPVLFAEGGKIDELKKELKDPQVLVLAGLLIGGVGAKLLAAYLAKKAKSANPVQTPAALPAN